MMLVELESLWCLIGLRPDELNGPLWIEGGDPAGQSSDIIVESFII